VWRFGGGFWGGSGYLGVVRGMWGGESVWGRGGGEYLVGGGVCISWSKGGGGLSGGGVVWCGGCWVGCGVRGDDVGSVLAGVGGWGWVEGGVAFVWLRGGVLGGGLLCRWGWWAVGGV